jgi:hypothetical protein
MGRPFLRGTRYAMRHVPVALHVVPGRQQAWERPPRATKVRYPVGVAAASGAGSAASCTRKRTDERLWVITEWDRSVKTLLLPQEY